MAKNKQMTISDYDIRVRAYRIWEKSGQPEGRAEENWREALAELEAERKSERRASPPAPNMVPPQPDVSRPPNRIVAEQVETPEIEPREDQAA